MYARVRRLSSAIGFGIVAVLAPVAPGRAPAQVVTANWLGTTGNWDNPNIWNTSPTAGLFPNNGQPSATNTYNTQVSGSGTITVDIPITVDQLQFQSGTIGASSGLTVNNTLTWTGGTFSTGGTINANGGVSFPGGSTGPTLTGSNLSIGNVAPTTSLWSGGNITMNGILFIVPGSTLQASSDGTMSGTGTFFNATFIKSGGTGTTSINPDITNNGIFEAASGTVATTGQFVNNGGTVLASGGTLQINGTLVNLSSGTLTNGTYQVQANSSLTLPGSVTTIDTNTTVELDGTNSNFASINSLATVNGTFRLTGGRSFTTAGNLAVAGTLDVQSGSLLNVSGSLSVPGVASITNGTVNVAGPTTVTSTLTVAAGATLGGTGTLTVAPAGTGALVVQGTVNQPVMVLSGGSLSGNAKLGSNLTIMSGASVSPGNSPGTITVGGNMTLNGNYDWDLDGNDNTMAGTTFDQINVTGTASLDPPAINVKFDSGGTLSFSDPFWSQPRTWLILDASQGLTEVAAPTLTTSDNSYQAIYPDGSFTTELQGTDGLLVAWNPNGVPEPGTTALTAVGLAVAGWAARRRRSKTI